MKATSSPTACHFQADNQAVRGVPSCQFGDRATAVFHLSYDIGSLNPRFRGLARQVLLQMQRRNRFTRQH